MDVCAVDGDYTVPEHEEFEIRPEEHTFSHTYTVLKKDWPVSVIQTNKYFHNFFDPRKRFVMNDSKTGEMVAQGIKNYGFTPRGIWNLSFMGWFRPHTLADFDFYDAGGNYIGCIDGKVLDMSKARFDFQDETGKVIAYAQQDKTQIMIKDYQTGAPLGFLKRQFDVGTADSWKMEITSGLDRRIVLAFAAFVVENQAHFLKDD